jgi:hypothetical protein
MFFESRLLPLVFLLYNRHDKGVEFSLLPALRGKMQICRPADYTWTCRPADLQTGTPRYSIIDTNNEIGADMRFETLTLVAVEVAVFWGVTPCHSAVSWLVTALCGTVSFSSKLASYRTVWHRVIQQ